MNCKILTLVASLILIWGLSANAQITYQHDALNRLTQVSYPNGAIIFYTYDANGNRLTQVTSPSTNFPVELLTFTGENVGEVNVLDWTTAKEENSAFFAVEKSVDGTVFERIGEVKASGNSTLNQSYSFTDKEPFRGINYYRLKMVDLDGTFAFSDIVELEYLPLVPLSVFPNPATDLLFVNWNGETQGTMQLEIHTLAGQLSLTENWENNSSRNWQIDVSALSPAVYIYTIKVNTKTFRGKLVIER